MKDRAARLEFEAKLRRARARALCWDAARYLMHDFEPDFLLDDAGTLLLEANILDGGRCEA